MKKNIHYILLGALLLMLNPSLILAQKDGGLLIRSYEPKEYGGAPQIFNIEQDHRGVIYIASDNIIEYDGTNWNKIPLSTGAYAFTIKQYGEDEIYVGGLNEFGYLDTDSIGQTVYRSLRNYLPDSTQNIGYVWELHLLEYKVIFYTHENLIVFDRKAPTAPLKVMHIVLAQIIPSCAQA